MNRIIIVLLCLFLGCRKDENYNEYFIETYKDILQNSLNFTCEDLESGNFLKAEINNQKACFFDGHNNNILQFYFFERYITSSPSTSGSKEKDFKGCIISIKPIESIKRQPYLLIEFPSLHKSTNNVSYLDSLFNIKDHMVISNKDVIHSNDSDFVDIALENYTGGFLKKFKIDLVIPNDSVGNVFVISSIFGDQSGSYVKILNYKKTTERDGIYYNLELAFKCNLYHFPQYGKSGLWSKLNNGVFVAKIKAD